VDLSDSGKQPMTSKSDRFIITFNGEIYNHRDLANELVNDKKINAFRGHSDTEILIEYIDAYGIENTLNKIDGMFAFALYDKQDKSLYFAIDRIGEKPLYYGYIGGALVFASDLSCLKCVPGFDGKINVSILQFYFNKGYISAPHTIYENVFKLEPGTYIKCDYPFNEYSKAKYYDVIDIATEGLKNPFKGNMDDAVNEFQKLLDKSVKNRMISDVPLGAFLSGGIDSPTIVSSMVRVSGSDVKTFTIEMDDEKFNEGEIAAAVAKHLGTAHTPMKISSKDAENVVPKLYEIFSEPFGDSSAIPTYLVSKLTKNHVTVSLSGDSGDELFGGYNFYESVNRIWNKTKKIPYPLRYIIGGIGNAYNENFSDKRHETSMRNKFNMLISKHPIDVAVSYTDKAYPPACDILSSDVKKNISTSRSLNDDVRRIYELTGDPITAMRLYDILIYHPYDILTKVDRCAMAVSLESRIPFLDPEIIKFAWSLPNEFLRDDKQGKLILRNYLYKNVPREIIDRPKKGFSIPVGKWIREGALHDWANELINENRVKREGILNHDSVKIMWENLINENIYTPHLWYVLMFEQWMEKESSKV